MNWKLQCTTSWFKTFPRQFINVKYNFDDDVQASLTVEK